MPELPRVLAGMAAVYLVKADLATAVEVGQAALAAAERTGDAFDLLSAHYQVAMPLLYQGHFSRALYHFEQSMGLYDPSVHGSLARTMGIDRGVQAHAFGSQCHVYCGHLDRALVLSETAVALAQRVQHPFSLATALFLGALTHFERAELDRLRRRADEVVDLLTANTVPTHRLVLLLRMRPEGNRFAPRGIPRGAIVGPGSPDGDGSMAVKP